MIRKLFSILSYPLRKEPLLYSMLLALMVVSVIASRYRGLLGVAPIISNTIFAYVLTTFVSVLPKYVNTIFRCIVLLYSTIFVWLAFFGALFVESSQAFYTLLLVLQTNSQEAGDFFQHYVHAPQVLITLGTVVLYAVCSYIIYWLLSPSISGRAWKGLSKSKLNSKSRSILTLVSWLTIISLSILPSNVLLGTPQLEFMSTDLGMIFNNHNLKEFVRPPRLMEKSKNHAQNIVMILGESHSSSHSALIGYDKQTNPLLHKLVDSDNLVVFDKVSAPAPVTVLSILRIMSTYSDSLKHTKEKSSPNVSENWWECQTIPTTMKAMGYATHWLTNQRDAATNDAVADSYGHLCDVFERTSSTEAYDGDLIPIIRKYASVSDKASSDTKRFLVVHLMGSHEEFSKRYPDTFNHFKDSDYKNYPVHQRSTLAQYDNSILYNDYIVNSVISLFANQSTIVLYLPDHGLDIYETDPNYAAHAKDNVKSRTVACRIPMYIFLSDKFKEQNPECFGKLKEIQHSPFNVENTIYRLVDLAGYCFDK